jgi:hypothetical protein
MFETGASAPCRIPRAQLGCARPIVLHALSEESAGPSRSTTSNSRCPVSSVGPPPAPGPWATGSSCRRDHSWRCNPGSSARGKHPRTLARTGAQRGPVRASLRGLGALVMDHRQQAVRVHQALSSQSPLQSKRASARLLVESTSSCVPVGVKAPVPGVAISLISLDPRAVLQEEAGSTGRAHQHHCCPVRRCHGCAPRQWLERSQMRVRPKVDGRLWERPSDPCFLHFLHRSRGSAKGRSRSSDGSLKSLCSPRWNERQCGAKRLGSHRSEECPAAVGEQMRD